MTPERQDELGEPIAGFFDGVNAADPVAVQGVLKVYASLPRDERLFLIAASGFDHAGAGMTALLVVAKRTYRAAKDFAEEGALYMKVFKRCMVRAAAAVGIEEVGYGRVHGEGGVHGERGVHAGPACGVSSGTTCSGASSGTCSGASSGRGCDGGSAAGRACVRMCMCACMVMHT
jgi:hypothetical protein